VSKKPLAFSAARASTAPVSPTREFVQGLERGFAVVHAFGADARELSITEVAQRTGLSRAVARRYLLTLHELGYVVQNGAEFSLTPRILDLGFTYLSTIDVANIAQPVMEEITNTLHESCSAAVLDGTEVVYVARVQAKRIMSINLVVGSRLPAHATSMGKVLLAYLPPQSLEAYLANAPFEALTKRTVTSAVDLRKHLALVRQRGWAFADQESEVGIRTVAAPLFNHNNQVDAALNVSGHAARVSMEELKRRYLPVLLDGARRISRALGATIPQTQAIRHTSKSRRPTYRPLTARTHT
jgi:IclR family transcriptional regulator, pca regulon regulatory protein